MTDPRPTAQTSGNTLSIIGIVCGVLAVLFVPIVLGPAGIILGAIGKTRNERLAVPAIVVAVIGMVLGFLLGALLYNAAGS